MPLDRARASLGLLVLAAIVGAACGREPVRTGPRQRVLLIGVDGATWHVMEPMMARGELPNVKALCDRGVHGDLLSMDPMVSPALWTTIATGTFPERHGVHGFTEEDPTTHKQVPVSSNLRKREALWTILTQRRMTTNLVGWYATWPAETIQGNIVTDHFLPRHESAFWPVSADEEDKLGGRTTPRELLKEVLPLVPTMQQVSDIDHLNLRFKDDGTPESEKFARLFEPHRVDETRERIGKYLMQKGPWDLTMVYFWGTDPTQHLFWRFFEPDTWHGDPIPDDAMAANRTKIPDYYAKIDRYVGDLVATAGPDAIVMIVSDHGFGPATGRSAEGMPLSGDHRKEGILVAAGDGIRKGARVDNASVVDVTPTILYLLGLPVGDDMDGRVIEALFDTPLPHPIDHVATWERGERAKPAATPVASPIDDQIRDQLKALGYLQ
jgi:predicted AlkP superfamily phosphohydrolase/phosphomutase